MAHAEQVEQRVGGHAAVRGPVDRDPEPEPSQPTRRVFDRRGPARAVHQQRHELEGLAREPRRELRFAVRADFEQVPERRHPLAEAQRLAVDAVTARLHLEPTALVDPPRQVDEVLSGRGDRAGQREHRRPEGSHDRYPARRFCAALPFADFFLPDFDLPFGLGLALATVLAGLR